MFRRIVAAAVVLSAFAQAPAFAQSTGQGSGSGSNATSPNNTQNLPKEIHDKLTSQGFTNVQVVPGSYLVSAKDKQGDPVTMIIGPHSLTMFTLEQAQSGASNQSGSVNPSGSAKK